MQCPGNQTRRSGGSELNMPRGDPSRVFGMFRGAEFPLILPVDGQLVTRAGRTRPRGHVPPAPRSWIRRRCTASSHDDNAASAIRTLAGYLHGDGGPRSFPARTPRKRHSRENQWCRARTLQLLRAHAGAAKSVSELSGEGWFVGPSAWIVARIGISIRQKRVRNRRELMRIKELKRVGSILNPI